MNLRAHARPEFLLRWSQRDRRFRLLETRGLGDAGGEFEALRAQLEASAPLSAADVRRQLEERAPSKIVVDDRILCGAAPTWLSDDLDRVLKDFREVRIALARSGAGDLIAVQPLASPSASFILNEQPDQLPLLTRLAFGRSDCVRFHASPDESATAAFEIPRPELMPEERLDGWFYKPGFREVRARAKRWTRVDELFELRRAPRIEPAAFPERTGGLAWINTEQIGLAVSGIVLRRIEKYVAPGADYPPLLDGDVLVALARRIDVKVARYVEAEVGPATTAKYIAVLRPRRSSSLPAADVLMACIRSDEFIDQVRMSLSDRLVMPILDARLAQVRLPPPEALSSPMPAPLPRLVSRLSALSCGRARDLGRALAAFPLELAESLFEPVGAARLRHTLLTASDDYSGPSLVIGSDETINNAVVRALREVARDARFEIVSLEPGPQDALIEKLASCSRAYLLTGSSNPLRLKHEYEAARLALCIAGADHAFVLVHPKDPDSKGRRFPGRQLIEHVFADEGERVLALDFDPATGKLSDLGAIEAKRLQAPQRFERALDELARGCADHATPGVRRLEEPLRALRRELSARTPGPLLPVAPARPTRRAKTSAHVVGEDEDRVSFFTYDESLIATIERFRARFRKEATRRVVYIEGETGTGKNLLARVLCKAALQPEPLQVSGLHSQLAETQLFGSVKGAFTGAENRAGLLEEAVKKGAPVFLDETNSLLESTQQLLLRLAQEGTFTRVGEEHNERVFSGLLICAANKPLDVAAREGKFRLDLLMRLGTPLVIPPLRERRTDIRLWLNHFLEAHARNKSARVPILTADAWSVLERYNWPGNHRELEILTSELCEWAEGGEVGTGQLSAWFPSKFGDRVPGRKLETGLQAPSADATLSALALVEAELRSGASKTQIFEVLQQHLGRKGKINNLAPWVKGTRNARAIRAHPEQFPTLNAYLDGLRPQQKKAE